ncbi:MAG TPA: lipopolysaccharide biosynthesis protein [Gammaproteobacteria bacterium]|nr:lipopolysaccharide biosynthesis protein [Gammaproteobacteria bacterium]
MNGNPKARVIAYYLPQFHPIPENDRWWGKGFTEWTNVARAERLYKEHYQPHIPADLGFYDLRCPESRAAQAELARAAGVEGFCYYHYWFGGRRILERPFNEVLDTGEPDFPFCLCWANHSWNSIWQGSPDKILIEQTYPGMDDYAAHFDYLLQAFGDDRYITVDGRPLFLIYEPDSIPEVQRVADYWRERALQAGLKGLYLVGIAHHSPLWDPRPLGFDACMMQKLPPRNGRIPWRYWDARLKVLASRGKYKLSVYTYEEMLAFLLRKHSVDFMDYPCVVPNWDNTPRAGMNGLVFQDSTPELFRRHLNDAYAKVADYPAEHRILFLKAWNEWAEGNYVEPDLRFGHGYLDVLRETVLGR